MRNVSSATDSTFRGSILPLSMRQKINSNAGGTGFGVPTTKKSVPTRKAPTQNLKSQDSLWSPSVRQTINSNAGGGGFGVPAAKKSMSARKTPTQNLKSQDSLWSPSVRQTINSNAGGGGFDVLPTRKAPIQSSLRPPGVRNKINLNAGGGGFGVPRARESVPANRAPMQNLNSKGSFWSPAVREAIDSNIGGAGFGSPMREPRFGIVPGGSQPSFGAAAAPRFGIVPGGSQLSFGAAAAPRVEIVLSRAAKQTPPLSEAEYRAKIEEYVAELSSILKRTGYNDDIVAHRVYMYIEELEEKGLSPAQVLQHLHGDKDLLLSQSIEDLPFAAELKQIYTRYVAQNAKSSLSLPLNDAYVRDVLYEIIGGTQLSEQKLETIRHNEEQIAARAVRKAILAKAQQYVEAEIRNNPGAQKHKTDILIVFHDKADKILIPVEHDEYQWNAYYSAVLRLAQDVIRQIRNGTILENAGGGVAKTSAPSRFEPSAFGGGASAFGGSSSVKSGAFGGGGISAPSRFESSAFGGGGSAFGGNSSVKSGAFGGGGSSAPSRFEPSAFGGGASAFGGSSSVKSGAFGGGSSAPSDAPPDYAFIVGAPPDYKSVGSAGESGFQTSHGNIGGAGAALPLTQEEIVASWKQDPEIKKAINDARTQFIDVTHRKAPATIVEWLINRKLNVLASWGENSRAKRAEVLRVLKYTPVEALQIVPYFKTLEETFPLYQEKGPKFGIRDTQDDKYLRVTIQTILSENRNKLGPGMDVNQFLKNMGSNKIVDNALLYKKMIDIIHAETPNRSVVERNAIWRQVDEEYKKKVKPDMSWYEKTLLLHTITDQVIRKLHV